MVKILKKKFITTSMIAITALIAAIFIAFNIANNISINNQLTSAIEMLARYGGDKGNLGNKEGRFNRTDVQTPHENTDGPGKHSAADTFLTSPFFTVRFKADQTINFIDVSQISSITEEYAAALAEEILESGLTQGRKDQYIFRVVEDKNCNGHSVICLDTSNEKVTLLEMLFFSFIISIIAWLVMLALISIISGKAIRPIAESIEKQKQFVTNAGHDLKTPLAIIQSNTEAMELYNGENKWSKNIKSQVIRLDELTKNLLTLSKLDESADTMVPENIDISSLVSEQAAVFAPMFSQKNIIFSTDIQKDLTCKGDRKQLTQMLTLILDNAYKYTNPSGKAKIVLAKKLSKISLTVSNTCDKLPTCPPEKLFDRFYRDDESRSQSIGGHGIGLSAVATIAANHGAAAEIEYDKGENLFICSIRF